MNSRTADSKQTWIASLREQGKQAEPSLLAELFSFIQDSGPLHICFEDLCGVARDIPFLQLSTWQQQHTCNFCLFAKWNSRGWHDCGRNKYAVNRLVLKRMSGFHGQCHLGLTDIVEPLVFHERVLGIFYYGSVVLQGTEQIAERRILKYCEKRKFESKPYLAELKRVPRISRRELIKYRERLRFAARLSAALLDSWGLPAERYRGKVIGPLWSMPRKHRSLPGVVQAAIHYVQKFYFEPMQVVQIAVHLSVHPVHLSRTFKTAMACDLGEYIQRVRIDHARQRLESSELSVAEVGYEVGFQEKSHFGRIFKKMVGVSPGEYRRERIARETHEIREKL